MEYSEERLGFIRRREEHGAEVTRCTFNEYCAELGLTESDLINKRILDVGSGKSDEFARRVKQLGGEVISISTSLADDYERSVVKGTPSKGENFVGGRGQAIPFQDKSFDLVVSLWAIPVYLAVTDQNENKSRALYEYEMKTSVVEMMRVLKDVGEVRMSPVGIRLRGDPGDEGIILDALGQETFDDLMKQGVSVSLERNKLGSPILVIRKPRK